MERLVKAIKGFGNRVTGFKNRIELGIMTVYTTLSYYMYAYADVQTDIKELTDKGIDFIFNFAGGAIILAGAFNLITAIYKFISASQARDGEQQREAGSGIAIALMILALGAAVFVLKAPISNLINTLITGV